MENFHFWAVLLSEPCDDLWEQLFIFIWRKAMTEPWNFIWITFLLFLTLSYIYKCLPICTLAENIVLTERCTLTENIVLIEHDGL